MKEKMDGRPRIMRGGDYSRDRNEMNWTVVWRNTLGDERRAETPSLEAALIQADYYQTRGLDVLHIEAPMVNSSRPTKSEVGALLSPVNFAHVRPRLRLKAKRENRLGAERVAYLAEPSEHRVRVQA
jgi:hypothetical protein